MIDKNILLEKLQDNQISGVLNILPENTIVSNDYKVEVSYSNNYLNLYDNNGKLILNDLPDYIIEFTPELINKEFNSILVGGLGLGIIPFVVQDFCETVDVVENNSDIISINQQLNALKSNVTIINGDIFSFEPTKNYDVIVMDIWYDHISQDMMDNLNSIYLPFLNSGGFIYYPINGISKEGNLTFLKWQN